MVLILLQFHMDFGAKAVGKCEEQIQNIGEAQNRHHQQILRIRYHPLAIGRVAASLGELPGGVGVAVVNNVESWKCPLLVVVETELAFVAPAVV